MMRFSAVSPLSLRSALSLCLLTSCLVTTVCGKDADDSVRYPGKEKRDTFDRSAELLKEWIAADPNVAANYAGLADVQIFFWCYGYEPYAEVMPECETAVRRALELDPDLAAAHTALGVVHMGKREWDAADRELKLATELDPNQAVALHWYALYLAAMNRNDEAEEYSLRCAALDSSPGMTVARSSILYFKRDWQGMIDVLTPVLAADPTNEAAYDWLGMAYVQREEFDKAIPTYLKAAEHSGELAEILGGLGHAYGMAGREQEARQVLDKMYRMAERWHVPPVQVAFVHVSLGEHDQALDLLETAYDERSWEMCFIQTEPWLDPLREEPRFVELIEKMNFPE